MTPITAEADKVHILQIGVTGNLNPRDHLNAEFFCSGAQPVRIVRNNIVIGQCENFQTGFGGMLQQLHRSVSAVGTGAMGMQVNRINSGCLCHSLSILERSVSKAERLSCIVRRIFAIRFPT